MNKTLLDAVRHFVEPYYAAKDEMHGIAHVERIADAALSLAGSDDVDRDLLLLGAYFHGLVAEQEPAIHAFLASLAMQEEVVARVLHVARESGKEGQPTTKEGIYLHDAHLIEGGRAFGIAKCLITGAQRGQTLEQTLDFIEQRLLGRFRCITPEAQAIFEERERFTLEFVTELRKGLAARHASL